jgi:ATP adenylyltransferase
VAETLLLAPGALEPAIAACEQAALASGALEPIRTEATVQDDAGVGCIVRIATGLARKAAAGTTAPAGARNPFLPYDAAMFVASITPTHVALLNKYPVQRRHLLLVTRTFVPQEALLDADDWLALAACLGQIDGLGFYNGGALAGASQPHKHLQLVPLPLAEGVDGVPIEPLLASARAGSAVAPVPALPCAAFCAWFDPATLADPIAGAELLDRRYRDLIAAAGIGIRGVAGRLHQASPYNLLVTRRWMLLVPRRRECFGPISLNALAFAGALFVRNPVEAELVRRAGLRAMLHEVGVPAGRSGPGSAPDSAAPFAPPPATAA